MPTISYAITACNEHVELERLLDLLNEYIRPEDEIIVQMDTTATDEVKKVVEKYNVGTLYEYHRIYYPLNNDFASFKNNLSKHCTRDYIFQIDADEYPYVDLIINLSVILENNSDTDVFLVPRINTVEGLTQEHIQKWGWRVENNRVNFPDYQWRIWKNKPEITWKNKVHEVLQGYNLLTNFPLLDELCLVHPKTIEKQEKQNNYYNTL
jgi:cellulose synthase/poly-beta-1,6-N-acetylglucosamine synthase-like glycosyltransferase